MSRSTRRATLALVTLLAVLAGGTAAATAADRYVALGDSYSSGTGTRSYTNAGCERSSSAYPALLAAARPNTALTFVACSGATTADVLANQISSVTTGTKLVSISVGGNDAGFADVLTECALPAWASNCAGAVANAQAYIRNTLPAKLDAVYARIRSRAPSAKVAVVGYPRIFNGEDCNAATFFSPADETALNATADLLRTAIRARAQARGFSFGDVIPGFVGTPSATPRPGSPASRTRSARATTPTSPATAAATCRWCAPSSADRAGRRAEPPGPGRTRPRSRPEERRGPRVGGALGSCCTGREGRRTRYLMKSISE